MAKRRSRRRFRRQKVSPDRAWCLVEDIVGLTIESVVAQTLEDQTVPLLTFEDITTDEANLTREDSEWFVQRIILDGIPDFQPFTDADNNASKAYEMALFTMNNRLRETTDQPTGQDIIVDNVYNRAARMLQTAVCPVHAHWKPMIHAAGNPVGALGAQIAMTFAEAATSTDTPRMASSPWYGSELVHWDLKSKFGLKEDTNLYLGIGAFLKDLLWDASDSYDLTFAFKARILVQRKRMR